MAKLIGDVPLTRAEVSRRYHERHPEKRSEYYQATKEIRKEKFKLCRHGSAQEWFDAKLIEQDNKCAVCFAVFVKTPHIDHDHRCCKPRRSCPKCRRDLLCGDCNLGLGRFKDDIKVLENAIQYLKRHKESNVRHEKGGIGVGS